MTLPRPFLSALPLALAACLALHGPAALAASSASSASSDAGSASSGSVSDSFGKSSDSSKGGKNVAAGDYRVVAVAPAAGPEGRTRVTLVAVADAAAEPVQLFLPAGTALQAGLAAGHVVSATARPYGLEFARADTREAFYLVLEDASFRELKTRPVGA